MGNLAIELWTPAKGKKFPRRQTGLFLHHGKSLVGLGPVYQTGESYCYDNTVGKI